MIGSRCCWLLLAASCASHTAPSPPTASAPRSDAIYFVFVDRFADGAPDAPGTVDRSDPQAFHGGDLRGVLAQLEHIEALGVGSVWLSPVTAMRTEKIDAWGAFHGYWVTDLGEVAPRFGTWEDVEALADALHDRGMRLYVDMVYNHVGYDAPLLAERPDWFHGKGDIVDWDDPVEVVTHDVHGLPDLAQEHPEVYAYLLERSVRWAEIADGFRIDAVRHLPPGFLARLGDDLRSRTGRELELLGEVFEGNPDALASRLQQDRLSSVFDFPLHYAIKDVFCEGREPGRLASVLPTARYGGHEALVTFVDNHDVGRIRSACGDDRVQQALAFWLTARGRPCITYGTEIGLTGAHEPDNRGDMRFGEDHPMGAAVRHWLGLRARWRALRDGRTVIHALGPELLVTSRVLDDEAALVVVNRGPAVDVAIPDALSGAELTEVWVTPGPVAGAGLHVPAGEVLVARLRGQFGAVGVPAAPVTVTLTARGVPLEDGDRAVLVGGGDALGGWDPAAGVVGVVEAGIVRFPVAAQPGDVLAGKLVVVRASGEVDWEDRGDRYVLVGPDPAPLVWGR